MYSCTILCALDGSASPQRPSAIRSADTGVSPPWQAWRAPPSACVRPARPPSRRSRPRRHRECARPCESEPNAALVARSTGAKPPFGTVATDPDPRRHRAFPASGRPRPRQPFPHERGHRRAPGPRPLPGRRPVRARRALRRVRRPGRRFARGYVLDHQLPRPRRRHVREIDTQPGTKLTYISDFGQISVPFSGVLHTTYPDGGVVGAPARLVMTGNTGPFSDLVPMGSGRVVLDGVVADTDGPFVFTRFTRLVSASGNFRTQIDRVCGALSG